jgi:putative redox protein
MGERLVARAELTNEKVQFRVVTGNRPELTCDYAPPLGDGQGYSGLELLLMSLCVCSGTSVVALLRQMKKRIDKFEVKGSGVRRDEHPTAFETISLEFVLNSDNTQDTEIQNAIQLSRESICPVWSMLKNSVEITTGYRINNSSST